MSDWASFYVMVGSSGADLIGIEPVWQDWIWYALLPCAVYAALALASAVLPTHTQLALFVIAGAALGLLLIGIHNAWDTVTHIVVPDEDES